MRQTPPGGSNGSFPTAPKGAINGRKDQRLGPGSLLVLDRGEAHSVRALCQDLVFVGMLHGERTARPEKVSGKLAQQHA